MKSWATLGFITVISLAINGIQYYQYTRTNFLLEIETKRNSINQDQINEFILSNRSSADNESALEYAKMNGKIEGIQSVVHNANPQQNEISSIWHAGYYRGLEQTDFVGEMKYEQGYAQGFQRGTNENMKAIQTILKSGDNIQSAIKNFVDEQAKKLDENKEIKPESKPSAK
jgi:hypothetical protein